MTTSNTSKKNEYTRGTDSPQRCSICQAKGNYGSCLRLSLKALEHSLVLTEV